MAEEIRKIETCLFIAEGHLMPANELHEMQAILSDNIKRLGWERGLAQERLGLESGVDRTMVSKIERQLANPTLEMLLKLAKTLEVPVTELLIKH